jgi:hypothetical protein
METKWQSATRATRILFTVSNHNDESADIAVGLHTNLSWDGREGTACRRDFDHANGLKIYHTKLSHSFVIAGNGSLTAWCGLTKEVKLHQWSNWTHDKYFGPNASVAFSWHALLAPRTVVTFALNCWAGALPPASSWSRPRALADDTGETEEPEKTVAPDSDPSAKEVTPNNWLFFVLALALCSPTTAFLIWRRVKGLYIPSRWVICSSIFTSIVFAGIFSLLVLSTVGAVFAAIAFLCWGVGMMAAKEGDCQVQCLGHSPLHVVRLLWKIHNGIAPREEFVRALEKNRQNAPKVQLTVRNSSPRTANNIAVLRKTWWSKEKEYRYQSWQEDAEPFVFPDVMAMGAWFRFGGFRSEPNTADAVEALKQELLEEAEDHEGVPTVGGPAFDFRGNDFCNSQECVVNQEVYDRMRESKASWQGLALWLLTFITGYQAIFESFTPGLSFINMQVPCNKIISASGSLRCGYGSRDSMAGERSLDTTHYGSLDDLEPCRVDHMQLVSGYRWKTDGEQGPEDANEEQPVV